MKSLPMILCACPSLLEWILLILKEHNFYMRANIDFIDVLNNLF
jgi:hypothetical protein